MAKDEFKTQWESDENGEARANSPRATDMARPVDNLRKRFKQLIEARQHGCNMTPEKLWGVWKVQIDTWAHEYWLLKLELKEHKRMREAAWTT